MLGWLVRVLLVAGGVIAGWLVGRDAPNFTFVQTVATLLLIVLVVAVLAFWPRLRNPFRRGDRDAGR
jgi:hypothetical protein